MNNKGFTISSLVYGILIIFLLLVFSTLSLLITRGNTLSKIKQNAIMIIQGKNESSVSESKIVADWTTMNISEDASSYVTIDYNINVLSPFGYRISNSVSGSTITYSVTDTDNNQTTIERTLNLNAPHKVDDYVYEEKIKQVILDPGLYLFEVWAGAKASPGTYSKGYFYTPERKIIYVNVGGAGSNLRSGYNDGTSYISLDKEGNDILISSLTNLAAGQFGSALTNTATYQSSNCANKTATETCAKQGDGAIKITSLIYYTK